MQLDQFTENGNYLMIAFDHRENFKKYINPKFPDKVTDEETINSIKNIIKSIKGDFSGILLDEIFSLPAFKALNIDRPFLLPVEKSGFEMSGNEKITVIDKNAIQIKNIGASGLKILVYLNPQSDKSSEILKIVEEAIEDGRKENLPTFLAIISEDIENTERVFDSVEFFLKKGVLPDVFALEFPGSDYLCRKVSNALGSIPWIVISGGADYILFKEQLKIAAENDCRGFIVGRSLWQEYFEIAEPERKEHFLEFTLPLRFKDIKEIMIRS